MKNYEIRKIEEEIIEIINNKFKVNIDNNREDCLELKLHNIGMDACDLLYLYFDIEKEFSIKISEEDILNNKFKTIKGIRDIIISHKNI